MKEAYMPFIETEDGMLFGMVEDGEAKPGSKYIGLNKDEQGVADIVIEKAPCLKDAEHLELFVCYGPMDCHMGLIEPREFNVNIGEGQALVVMNTIDGVIGSIEYHLVDLTRKDATSLTYPQVPLLQA